MSICYKGMSHGARKSTDCAMGLWFSNCHSVVWSLKSYARVLIPIGLLFPFHSDILVKVSSVP